MGCRHRQTEPVGHADGHHRHEFGRRTLAQPCDVSETASIEQLSQAVLREFGDVQILVNCAGRTKRMPTMDFPEPEWNSIMDTNLTGTLRASRVFGRHMIERKYGRIINIASLSSFVALYEVAAYSASKAAVASLTKSLAIEWAPHGVCVNGLAGGVDAAPSFGRTRRVTSPRRIR